MMMKQNTGRQKTRKWWIIGSGLLLLLAVGVIREYGLFSTTAEYFTDASFESKLDRLKSQPITPVEIDEDAERVRQLMEERTDYRGRLLFPPTTVAEMKYDPELVAGIPWEKNYEPVPLNEVEVTYTENQFQQERADWYQNLFLTEYEEHGEKDPRWDEPAREFLKEAARWVSIARFRKHRSPKFYPDQSDAQLAEQGTAVVELGCRDPLVISLVIEALASQKMYGVMTALTQQLNKLYTPDRYSEIVSFQILKSLVLVGKGTDKREAMSRHFLKAIKEKQLSGLERRIYLEEMGIITAPAHQPILGPFMLALESQENADPWLKSMILGSFYNQLGTNGSTLREYWPPYTKFIQTDWAKVKSVFMGHLRKSYRLYLQAYQLAPELPEAPLKLYPMSYRQNPQMLYADILLDDEGEFDRLSPASPRYWFDRAVAAQFDYRPMYRLYRGSLIPSPAIYENWKRYQPVLQFGMECLNSERFDTQVPFGFQDALQAMIAGHEFMRGPGGARSREVYGSDDVLPQMQRMVKGYASHLSVEQKDHYETLLAGMNWIQGHEEIAQKQFAALGERMKLEALQEVSLNVMELKRSQSPKQDNDLLTVDMEKLRGIGYLSDRSQLMISLDGGRVQTWDLKTRQMLKEYTLFPDVAPETTLAKSISDNVKFISCYQQPEIKIFETVSFTEVASLKLPADKSVKAHRVSNTGKYIAVALADQVELWEVATQSRIAEINIRAKETMVDKYDWRDFLQLVREVHFTADDSKLAFVRGGIYKKFNPGFWSPGALPHVVDVLYVWDLQQKKLIYTGQPFLPNINSIGFTENGLELLVSGTKWSLANRSPDSYPETVETHTIGLLNLKEGKIVREYAGRNKPLWVPKAFGKDRAQLIAMAGNELLVWDWKSGRELTSLQQHSHDVRYLLTSKEQDRMLTVDKEGVVKLFDGQLVPQVRQVLTGPDLYPHQQPHTIQLHAKTGRMGVCNGRTGALIWDFSDPKTVTGRLYRSPGPIGTRALGFSSDLKYLATTATTMPGELMQELAEPTPVSIWDTASGEVVRILEGETDFVESGVFDPSGRYFVSGLKNGNILIWDLETESSQPVQVLKEHVASVTKLKFSPDGKTLLSGGCGGESFGKKVKPAVKVWTQAESAGEFQVQQTMELDRHVPPTFGIQDLDLSSDGKWILASCNHRASLFSREGELRCTVEGGALQFLPEGNQFLTGEGGAKKAIHLWDLDGAKVRTYAYHPQTFITALALSPKEDVILSSSYGDGIKGWFVESGEQVLFLSDILSSSNPQNEKSASEPQKE
jgi:WD40 repeat protein